MNDLLVQIRRRLAEGAYPNEASISLGIVMPLLRSLGWEDSDPQQVVPEYASGGRRVDFALFGGGHRPSVFIEVKGIGKSLDGDKQLFEYAFHEGIPLCVLTDGRDWSFYIPGGQGNYDDRRVYRLQLDERHLDECTRIFRRYLSRSRVKSGDAFDDALRDYRDLASSREAVRNIPTAWRQLVEEPEDLLIELLSEQTEKISGYRPKSAEVTAFLRSLKFEGRSKDSKFVSVKPILRTSEAANPNHQTPTQTIRTPNGSRAIGYEILGKKCTASDASSAFVDILRTLAQHYPNKIDEIAQSVRSRTRNHIARSVEEIYPARPDLARAVEFASGWLVGLNIANREKARILREACKITGLSFGSDVIIEMPNA